VACGALLDSRDLPRSKRTQPIDNGTKHTLAVTYIELNESRMSRTQWQFHPKIRIFIVSCYANIYSSRLVKIKRCPTTSTLPHVNSHSRVRSKRSLSRLRAFRACSNWSERVFTNARDPALSKLTNGWISDSSECSDVSELVFERALRNYMCGHQLLYWYYRFLCKIIWLWLNLAC